MLTQEQQLDLVGKAGRAPSPHNIQPARWHFRAGEVQLFEQTSRWLSVGDPAGRDNLVSLGMAWEGMSLAMSASGFMLRDPLLTEVSYPPSTAHRLIASAAFDAGGPVDPLSEFVEVRRCWRGRFPVADAEALARINGLLARHGAIVAVAPAHLRATIAQWYDDAAVDGLRDRAFAHELYRWMRFSASDSRWVRDGLSTDCLALSGVEAFSASIALQPQVVRVLAALGLARLLVSEADKVRSAAAVVVLHAPQERTDFDAGRGWYRFWLSLASEGIAAVPMSAIKDSPRHARLLHGAFGVPAEHRVINCMRLGPAPAQIPRSARLPASELLL